MEKRGLEMQHNIVRYALRGGMAASFLVAGLMLTPAPLNAFAENELTAVEAGQPSVEEQAPKAGETTETTAQEGEQTQETGEQNTANPTAESPDQNQQQTAPVSSVAVDGEHAVEANSLSTVYVSQNGNDETGNGTADHPLKSLEWAVTAAAKDATINVMTDLDARNTARYYDKRLTIKSVNGNHTIMRSKDFGHISDTARSWYNGGLIEVGSVTGANDASLTLENITLDDQGIHFTADKTGKKVYFIQAQNAGGNTHFGSEDINHMYIAQDSIIATYGGTANITLGKGATLKNFGGMSAVRLAGGKLTMLDGSKIVDDTSVIKDRIKGTTIQGEKDKNLYGPAGALWIQGGTVDMQKGSEISGIVGRAIYEDGNGINVTVNGRIAGITPDTDMWQGTSGVAVHARTSAQFTLGTDGTITGISGASINNSGNVVDATTANVTIDGTVEQCSNVKNVINVSPGTLTVSGKIANCSNAENVVRTSIGTLTISGTIENCANVTRVVEAPYDQKAKKGTKLTISGQINNCTDVTNVVHVSESKDNLKGSLSGTIQNCTATDKSNGYILNVETSDFDITGAIQNCTATIAPVYAQAGTNINLYGALSDNAGGEAGAIFLYGNWNGGRDIVVTMHDGSKITGNKQTGSKQRGIICSGGGANGATSLFNQNGGEISNNEGSAALMVRKNGQATMNGGSIINNVDGGVEVQSSSSSQSGNFFTMNAGEISGNKEFGISASFGNQNYVNLLGGTIQNNGDSHQVAAKYGQGNDANERIRISKGVVKGNTTVDVSLGEVTLDGDFAETWLGSPKTAAKNEIKELVQGVHSDWTSFSKNGLWFKPSTKDFHFTAPRPEMGEFGKSGICVAYIPLNEDGTPVESKDVTIREVNNDSIVDVSLTNLTPGQSYALMFVNNNEYTLKPDTTTIYTGGDQGKANENPGFPVLSIANSVDSKSGENTLKIDGEETKYDSFDALMADLLNMLEVTYVDADGNNVIKDDTKPGAYTAKLAWKDGVDHDEVKINGNDVVGIADGSLVVRHVSDIKAAQDATNINSMLLEEPASTATVPTVVEKVSKFIWTSYPDYYLNGDESRVINKDNANISLMWDAPLLGDKPGNREQLLENKVANQLGDAGQDQAYRYDFKYLDLVDANNGNAWVSAEYGSIVYLPYPDGLTKDDDIQLVHFKGLNREYGINGQPLADDAINASTTETMKIEKTDAGIRFEAPKGGFGLYALAWKTTAHTIEATAGEGGTITPNGTVTVGEGADKTFDITPADGYIIADVTVDGESMGPVSSYTFEKVNGDHAIVASFRKAQHTITATAGEGGTIDPAGSVAVKDGGDQKFTITPNKGYKIADVKVDGKSVGKVASYTFAGVTADHVIEVTFEAEPVIPAHKHTWGDWQYDGKNHWHVCTVCGETADEAAHTWGDWTVVTEATETTDGLREHVCEVCGCR